MKIILSQNKVPIISNIGYFRFHGRNADAWWTGDNEPRYKYLYSTDEIKVKLVADKTDIVFAVFNNHWQGYAPKNAIDLMKSYQLPLNLLSHDHHSDLC